ncbi:MAG: amidohydrolase family protein [Chlorobi bacterium]|nr:amidohydrolase family protein [Chlorobiota bacterium]
MIEQKRNADDILIYNNEIRLYLPEKIFDAHTHLCKRELHEYLSDADGLYNFSNDVSMNELEDSWTTFLPDLEVTGLIMGSPVDKCDLDAENKFVAQSITNEKNRFSLMISPKMSLENLENDIDTLKPAGLKPYLLHALVEDKQNARITDYITEEQLNLANEHGLSITLHVSKPRGMADPENLEDISRLIDQYPKAQFILAHCGRNFIAPNMAATLDALPVAENLWIDTSAVCDIGVFLELFSRYDLSRIIYGSDLVDASAFRGNYIRLGMSWHVVTPNLIERDGGLESRATFAIYENLRALFHAARFCNVREDDIQNIFYNNAAKLFKL